MWYRFANASEATSASITKVEDDESVFVVVVVIDDSGDDDDDDDDDDDWEDDGDKDGDDRGGSRFLRKVDVHVLLHSFTSQVT